MIERDGRAGRNAEMVANPNHRGSASPIETVNRELVAELETLASLTVKLEDRLSAVLRPDSDKKQGGVSATPIRAQSSALVEMFQSARATANECSHRITDILTRLEL